MASSKIDWTKLVTAVIYIAFMAGAVFASVKVSINGVKNDVEGTRIDVKEIRVDVKELGKTQNGIDKRLIRVETKIEDMK